MSSAKQSWQLGDAGILRKKEEEDELLVFGYSCKLFRDDEKALFIDQGKHLIPWMGDDSLKIDRYDGRGALYDLKQYEAPPGGYDENVLLRLSDAERRVEVLCNEERYHSLHRNDEEDATYQEEELKRLHQALDGKSYGEVAFNYDAESTPSKSTDATPDGSGEAAPTDEEDELFVPPPELDIPVNMALPETVKLNAIIEKTALFISGQGPQMEILLKMKQAGNPQFDFLSYDAALHPYYRHLQMAIKTGRYRPKPEKTDPVDKEDEGEDGDYLHPSLASGSARVELAPSIPSIAYKPSANCAYSMLVNRIKDKQAAFSVQPPGTSETVLPTPVYREPVETAPVYKAPLIIEATPVLYNVPPKVDAESGVSSPVRLTGAVTLAGTKVFTPVTQTARITEDVPPSVGYNGSCPAFPAVPSTGYTVPDAVASTSFLKPPTDVQLIVDKMASYVAKNGRDFESIVRAKGDPRFEFLKVAHQYYPYYLHKVDMYEQEYKPKQVVAATVSVPKRAEEEKEESEESSESEEESGEEGDVSGQTTPSTKPALAPVCFSIKKPRDSDQVLDMRSALPLEESSDEEGQETTAATTTTTTKKEEEPPAMECIDLTSDAAVNLSDEVEEKRASDKDRRAEEKVKDKLAAAAREKLASSSREKQLQLERKRRAAAFLTMIHKPSGGETQAKQPRSRDDTPRASCDDEDSVTSIPSPMSTTSTAADGAEERLKANGGPTSLLARLQAGREMERRQTKASSDSDERGEPRKQKKAKSSHKRDRPSSPPHRSHKHRRDQDHVRVKKSKKRARSKSPKPRHARLHRHHSQREPTSRSTESRSKKKSEKRSKRERRSSVSDYSS